MDVIAISVCHQNFSTKNVLKVKWLFRTNSKETVGVLNFWPGGKKRDKIDISLHDEVAQNTIVV